MYQMFIVGIGGFLGSVLRYLLSGWITRHFANTALPFGTILVNLIGCFAVGILGGIVSKAYILSFEQRLFLFTGVLGGFTTFSAFGLETVYSMRQGDLATASLNVVLSVGIGCLLCFAGFRVSEGFFH